MCSSDLKSAFAYNQLTKLNFKGNSLIKIEEEAFYENEKGLKNVVLYNYPRLEKRAFDGNVVIEYEAVKKNSRNNNKSEY